MKNVHLQYKVFPPVSDKTATDTYGQAYVKAEDHVEAEAKLKKFLGAKVKFEVTQFADANAEVIA